MADSDEEDDGVERILKQCMVMEKGMKANMTKIESRMDSGNTRTVILDNKVQGISDELSTVRQDIRAMRQKIMSISDSAHATHQIVKLY